MRIALVARAGEDADTTAILRVRSALEGRGHDCHLFLSGPAGDAVAARARPPASRVTVTSASPAASREFLGLVPVVELAEALADAAAAGARVAAHGVDRFDVVHAWSPGFETFFLPIDCPVVLRVEQLLASVRSAYDRPPTAIDAIIERLEHAAIDRAGACYATSDRLSRAVSSRRGSDVEVVLPTGPDPFADGPTDPGWADRTGLGGHSGLVVLGPLCRLGGSDLVIDALDQVLASRPELHAHFVGADRGAWPRALHAAGAAKDRLHLHARPAPHRLLPMLARSEVVVFPDVSGALPSTVLDALAVGTPVVAARGGACEGLVIPQTGLLLSLVDREPAALARALRHRLPRSRVGADLRAASALEARDCESIDRLERCLEEAVRRGRQAPAAVAWPDLVVDHRHAVDSLDPRVRDLATRIAQRAERRVVVYGAGLTGRHLASELRRLDVEVVAFVDRDPRLRGRSVDDIPVVALDEALTSAEPVFAVGSLGSVDAIRRMIARVATARGITCRVYSA
jgi:glycosyltransferase involved in cell wall biosynthesis